MNLTGVWKEKVRQVKHKVGLIFSGRIENMKKRITLPVCLATLALCMITPTALAAGKTYDPVFVEKYTYGSFDELRIQKVYQLSPADDPSGIPTEDFEQNGRLYYLLYITQQEEDTRYSATDPYTDRVSKTDCDVITYTVTFGSKELDKSIEQERGPAQAAEGIISLSAMGFAGIAIILTAARNTDQKRGK